MTIGDKILVVVMALLTAGSFFAGRFLADEGKVVIIDVNDLPVYKGDLQEDRKVTIRGLYGDVLIQIKGGEVAVVRAECPNKVCVRTGWRSLAGESIICVPNRVLIRIVGNQTNQVRGITG